MSQRRFNAPDQMKRPRWRVIVLLVLLFAASFGTYSAWRFYELITEGVPDMYAQWWVGDMVIEYMKGHDDAWPKNWDDLREPYATCVQQAGNASWSFDELRSRVDIDFSADPAALARVSPSDERSPPFRVIWARSGKRRAYDGAEPNEMVFKYLTKSKRRSQ